MEKKNKKKTNKKKKKNPQDYSLTLTALSCSVLDV